MGGALRPAGRAQEAGRIRRAETHVEEPAGGRLAARRGMSRRERRPSARRGEDLNNAAARVRAASIQPVHSTGAIVALAQ